MTTNEKFKRRIRARMAKTGERYGAARRSLLTAAAEPLPRGWVSQPEMSDDAIRKATARSWDEWCTLIERFPGHNTGHSSIVTHLMETYGLDGWWAQGVTVSYERIRGLRLPHQSPDGTFTANRSKTITVDADALRSMLLDDVERKTLFPAFASVLRSKPASKNLRIGVETGSAEISLQPTTDGRTKVVIAHTKLPSADDVAVWKQFWGEWIDALDEPG
jgi:hypothetical protein